MTAAADWWSELPDDEPTFRLESPGEIFPVRLAPGVKRRDYGLWWYQVEAKLALEVSLETNDSAIIVMATGTGKTKTIGALVGDWPGNVLWLAHRDELIIQARDALEAITGEMVEIEQGQTRASARARIVVGSIDTVKRQNRLDRFGKDRFGLVVFDEFHHALAPSYRKCLEFFNAKLVGMTATPDRGDEMALGQMVDEVAYVFDIQQGIEQGYLVPIRAHMIEVKEIDISEVKTQAGDLVAAQLDEVMLKACAGVVTETLKYEPDRQGIWFFPGVKSAELAASLINKARPGTAGFVSGATDQDERRETVKAFREGRLQHLCNCNLFVEGTDLPTASMIVQARPTKSRALACQQVGRGTRVLPGVIAGLDGKENADARRAAIAASAKCDLVVLDFVGNCGRHTLVTPTDILGGNYTEAEVALAKKRERSGGDVLKALEAARAELRRIAEKASIRASSIRREVDPFAILHIQHDASDQRFGRQPMTPGQFDYLDRMGVPGDQLNQMSKAEASKLITASKVRRDKGLCTFKQLRILQQNGVTDINVGFARAHDALDYIIGERRAGRIPEAARIDSIIHRLREPGEEA